MHKRYIVKLDREERKQLAELVKKEKVAAKKRTRAQVLLLADCGRHGPAWKDEAITEPLTGWRHIAVTDRRTKTDWAHEIRKLVDVHRPNAERITLVMDNLNTHSLGSLYEAFPPQEARRIIHRIEVVHTPKHGSWLNMAEIELNVLTRQCLARRIPDKQTLIDETTAWQAKRNGKQARIDWQFTADDARIKLKHLYPKTQS
jgi:hypothetical protein